jgi:Na+-translocating ferredoxin:NAD+ oxidoreductase subunit G
MLERLKSKKFYPVIFLTLIVLISVSLLLYINSFTANVVEAKNRAKIKAVLEEVFPHLTDFEEDGDIYVIYAEDVLQGYAFSASGSGYGGVISMLVGIDTDYRIKDVAILSHSETPGLGGKITEQSFTGQFKGLEAGDIALSKDGGRIDAITGATISSRAVTEAVYEKMADVIEKLSD